MFYRLKGNLMRVIRDDINIYPFSSLRLLLPHMAWHGRQNNANCFSTKIPAVAEETKCSQQEAPHPSTFGSSGLIF